MTITVNGVEIEIQGVATVRVDGDKVIIEVGEREPARFIPWNPDPYPYWPRAVPRQPAWTIPTTSTDGTVMLGRNDPMYKLWSYTGGHAPAAPLPPWSSHRRDPDQVAMQKRHAPAS